MDGSIAVPPTTFVLVAGAGSAPWIWHLVEADLRAQAHGTVAVDLPCDDDRCGLDDYVDAAVAGIGSRTDLVVVGQSMGALTATLLCDRLPVDLLVLVAAMVPAPGETPGEWWANTGWEEARRAEVERLGGDDSDEATFLHDIPRPLLEANDAHRRGQSETPFVAPWPLEAWPDVPTRYLLCRDDRFFPAEFVRRMVHDRLGIAPDEMPGGHVPMLAHPHELAARLHAYASGPDRIRRR